MELKVNVDGIYRVVCGVTEASTCHDVVLALAHAMNKTGRFTLVEKWRDNERPLMPKECPVQILHKWGEYAHEVQFVLKHPEQNTEKPKVKVKEGERPQSRGTPKSSPPQNKENNVKRSLTFSGTHNSEFSAFKKGPLLPSNFSKLQPINDHPSANSKPTTTSHKYETAQTNMNLPSAQPFSIPSCRNVSAFHGNRPFPSSSTSQSTVSLQSTNLTSQTHNQPHNHHDVANASSRLYPPENLAPGPISRDFVNRLSPAKERSGSGNDIRPGGADNSDRNRSENSLKNLNTQPQHKPVRTRERTPEGKSTSPFSWNPSDPSGRNPSMSPVVQNKGRSSAFSPVIPNKHSSNPHSNTTNPSSLKNPSQSANHTQSNGRIPGFSHVPSASELEEYDLDSNFPDILRGSRKDVLIEEYHMPDNGQEGVVRKVEPNAERMQMQRMVSMQQERIKLQETQLQLIDTELANLEDRDRQRIDQQHSIVGEMGQLQQKYNQNEVELVEMDTVKWVDVVEQEKTREKQYHDDISGLKVKLETCSSSIEEKNKYAIELESKFSTEKKEYDSLLEEQKRETTKMQNEISDVKKEIAILEKNMKDEGEELSGLVAKIKDLDAKIEEKSNEIVKLEKNISEINLEIFSSQSSPEKVTGALRTLEGRLSPAILKGRQIATSPLSKILAASKNPNGVWV